MRTRVDVISPTDNGLYNLMTEGVGRLVKRQMAVDGVVEKSRKVGDQFYEVSAQVETGFFKGSRVTEVTIERSNFDDEKPSLEIKMAGNGRLRVCFTDDYLLLPDFARIDLAGVRIEGGRKVIEKDDFLQLQPPTRDVLFGEVRKAFFGI